MAEEGNYIEFCCYNREWIEGRAEQKKKNKSVEK